MNEMAENFRLLQNLKDAGCDEKTIQIFLKLQYERKTQEQYRLLSIHRKLLLEKIHISQHMIDCLDYLIYSMKKQ